MQLITLVLLEMIQADIAIAASGYAGYKDEACQDKGRVVTSKYFYKVYVAVVKFLVILMALRFIMGFLLFGAKPIGVVDILSFTIIISSLAACINPTARANRRVTVHALLTLVTVCVFSLLLLIGWNVSSSYRSDYVTILLDSIYAFLVVLVGINVYKIKH